MVSVLGRGEREGDEAGVATRPRGSAVAQMAVGQWWGKYLVPIPSTWKSSDVSSWLHYILDQASGLSCITTLRAMQVASEEALHRAANDFVVRVACRDGLTSWADAYMLNSCNFMLNIITDATFLTKTCIFMCYPHTAPHNQLLQRARTGGGSFRVMAARGWILLLQQHTPGRILRKAHLQQPAARPAS